MSQDTKPFFDNLMENNIINNNIFSIYLERRHLSAVERTKANKMEISPDSVRGKEGWLIILFIYIPFII